MRKGTTAIALAGAALLAACVPQVAGSWKITAICPPQSQYGNIRIDAQADVVEIAPNVFRGTVTNNLQQRGSFDSRLDGDALTSRITWEGLGPTESLLVYDRASGSFRGLDSNGCTLSVIRP